MLVNAESIFHYIISAQMPTIILRIILDLFSERGADASRLGYGLAGPSKLLYYNSV